MCGITGYINLNNKPVKDTSTILKMLEVQKHRGPDDSGVRAFSLSSGQSLELDIKEPKPIERKFEGILGFNRLSILDLSENGHQPMVSPDGNVILTLNGEIYNAFDYKEELKEWGYIFKSTSDTEVVLALYLRYGFDKMLDRLNGMFAIAVVDLLKRTIFVTRDRFGIKPLYYIINERFFAFSSELKSFKYLENFKFRLNEHRIDEYLIFRNNLNGTLFKEIESLTPGNYIVYSEGSGLVKKQYFDVNNYKRDNSLKYDLPFYEKKTEEWLGRSVESQLMSDVKLGCQLSGGIDSSLVTWLANRTTTKGNFESVSIIFDDKRFSEENYIDSVSEKLGIISHKFSLDSEYYLENIEKVTWHLESPINHPNTVAIYKLSQRAKDYVTVLLSGEGADEVFGGYTRFYDIAFPFKIRKFLHEVKKGKGDLKHISKYLNHEYRAVMATAYMRPQIARKLKHDFKFETSYYERESLYRSLSGSFFDRQVKYELKSFLPDLLIRQDKMSMAHSIENRVPFLDNDVVSNSFTIPEKFLLLRKSPEGYNTEKYLLKKMASVTFGDQFAFRDKMGFGIPLREFLLKARFTDYLNDKILPGIKCRGIFNSAPMEAWLVNLNTLKYYKLDALWVMLTFEIWASLFIDTISDK